MTVVVLAGGDGRRMRPLTTDTPKVLLPVRGRPLLTFAEEWLASEGVTQVELTAGVFADTLRGFAAHSERRVNWQVREETAPLGEAGCLARFGGREVLAVAGDLLLSAQALSLTELTAFHRRRHAAITAVVVPDENGTAAVAADGTLRTTGCPAGFSPWSLGGVVLLSGEATARLVPGERLDMAAFLDRLIREGLSVCAFSADLFGIDTPREYRRAVQRAGAPFVGQTARLGEGAVMDERSCVEDGAVLGAGARIVGSIIGSGAVVGDNAVIRDCVIDARAEIGRNARLGAGCVIGRGARVAPGVTLSPGVRVWPGMSVAGDCLRPAPFRWRDTAAPLTATPLYEWTAARLAAAGAALGSEWGGCAVLVGAENVTAAGRISALLAGLGETGCAVRNGGEMFLAEMAYLTAALPVKRGVFLAESGLCLLGEDGRELPRAARLAVERRLELEDVSRRAPYEWQPPQTVAALRGLYRDWLFCQAADIRPVALELCGDRAAGQRLWEVLELTGCTQGDALRLRLSDGGRRLAVYTPKTGYLDADRVEELLRWEQGETSPRPDGLAAALCLLRLLGKYEGTAGEALAALDARLPSAVTVCRTAEITPETAAALRELSGEYVDSEGVRVASPNGVVTVRPSARGRLLAVLARAEKTEVAQELCAGMMERLHTIPLDNPL